MNSRYRTVQEVLEDAATAVDFLGREEPLSLTSVGTFGNQPLAIVVTWDDPNAVGLLLDAGAPIDAQHEDGDTALHHAIRMGHFGIARLLIERGADQTIRNLEGRLARDYCWEGEWDGLGLAHDA
jgi:ankyrin repeat protein